MAAAKDELRRQLNLKNLQRHDPTIDRIVASTSYASIYDNKGQGWVKTGVEGPMFLFSRTIAPHYGFFVLNRNGLEYVQEFLTPESEVQVGGEFILYESGKDADRATGIWVFEEKERHELCRQMEQVRARAASSEGAKATAPGMPRGQSISIDMLFNSASPTPAAAQLPMAPSIARPAPTNPLDALFASAALSPLPAPASATTASPQGRSVQAPPHSDTSASHRLPSTLEELFAAASPTPQAAHLPFHAQQHPLPDRPPVADSSQGGAGGMALLDSIFASAAQNSSPRPATMQAPVHHAQTPQPALDTRPNNSPRSVDLPRSVDVQTPVATSVDLRPQPSSPSSAAAPSQPRDARDLLAMLGGVQAPPTSHAGVPWQAQPVQAMPSGALAPKPQTTVHPQGLSMDPQPGAIGHEPTITSPSSRTDSSLPVSSPIQHPVIERGEREAQSQTASQTMFAPPILSHDIFATLPVPGQRKYEPGPRRLSPSPNGQPAAIGGGCEPLPPSPMRKPTASEEGMTSPDAETSSATKRSASNASILLSKVEMITAIDDAVSSARVGLDGAGAASRSGNRASPLSKEDFISQAMSVIQKPSFMTQLYGRYLERYEEQHE